MEVIHPRCAGMDVSKKDAKVCIRVAGAGRRKTVESVTTWGSTTRQILALRDHLVAERITCVVMEATGDYWKPFYYLLEELPGVQMMLVNARHVKNLPGRKTDVNDATWLADLLAHGLIRASFVPDSDTQVLRNLLRTRKQLVRERSSHVQRLQKTLEDANIKLDSVVTDIIGMTGRAMLEALIVGETDPSKLAALAHPRIKAPPAQLREALRGRIMKHHRFLLRLHLQQIDAIDTAIAEIDREVNERIEPFRTTVELLTTIPGISELGARIIAAEIGNDMSRFATAAHLVSWAGLCPKNDESAGKRRSTRMRKGAPWLKTTLIQCCWAATRKKGSYIQAQFHRIRSRRGVKKAIGAVAASILTAIYHMLKNGTCYQDLGHDHFDRRAKTVQTKRLVARLQNLGYAVQITPLAA